MKKIAGVKSGQKPTKKQLEELKMANDTPIIIDEDAPTYSKEEMKILMDVAKQKHLQRQKSVVSIRLDQESIDIAKQFGSGYTGLLSKLIYIGLRDPEILKRAL